MEAEGHRRHIVARLLQEQRRNRRVHPAAHRHHDAAATVIAGATVTLDEHLAGPAVQVVLKGLVQRVEDQSQRVGLTGRQRSAKGVFEVRL